MLRRLVSIGFPFALAGGAGVVLYQRRLASNSACTPADIHNRQPYAIAQFLKSEVTEPLKLYQFRACPFCGRVKALLNYLNLPYYIVEVDPMLKSGLPGDYSKVPQLLTAEGVHLVGSDEIVDMLSSMHKLPITPDIQRWRDWATMQLSRYIVLCCNRTMRDAVHAMSYVDNNPSDIPLYSRLMAKALGAPVMYCVAHYKTLPILAKDYGYQPTDQPYPALAHSMATWLASFPKNSRFHGGQLPDLADVEVYGVLEALKCSPCHHQLLATPAGVWMNDMRMLLELKQAPAGSDISRLPNIDKLGNFSFKNI
eukprot:NODE_2720_length_1111_cov_29.861789_g2596_i0.p1 GENE.NODE_2720_length_1111_cov_29.861789_g2596_i0~~NODE_2720_length_1111_cov_29.861789_g2596_i0.p1  ORF type:complete len:330 (+),score=90.81 NODE_2720_length_1111_cov_29.861789_g2596_i0:59-991(+)